jgi:hypothetical protein
MFKKRRDAAMKVAESLFAAEEAIDAAIARAAEFNCTLVTARTDAQLSALVGQDAFEVAAAAFASLAKARADIVETHKRLSEAKIQVGLRTISFGDSLPKPPKAELREGAHLQAVA